MDFVLLHSISTLATEATLAVSALLVDQAAAKCFEAKADVEKIQWRYCHADSNAFADVVSRITGWAVFSVANPSRGPVHRIVKSPDGRMLDASGWCTLDDLRARFKLKRLTLSEIGLSALGGHEEIMDEQRNLIETLLLLPTAPFTDSTFRQQVLNFAQGLGAATSKVDNTFLPVFKTKEVFHVGLMAPEAKGTEYSRSLEGNCLSVSHCPDAWTKIARLGGVPTWRMHTRDGRDGRFLDVLAVSRDVWWRRSVEEWAIENGYAEYRLMWRAWFEVCEGEEWGYTLLKSETEAIEELDIEENQCIATGRGGLPLLECILTLCGTEKLALRLGGRIFAMPGCFDFAAIVWAQDTLDDLDGVWWHEEFAPEKWSAPRGGIFPSKLSNWTALQTPVRGQGKTQPSVGCFV